MDMVAWAVRCEQRVGMMTSDKRICWIDRMRGIGCVGVILIHVFGGITNVSSTSKAGLVQTVGLARSIAWSATETLLARWAVPCFLMITGYLLLCSKRSLEWRRSVRYARRMACVLLTFGLLFCVLELWHKYGFVTPDIVWRAVVNLLRGKSWTHMWYVYALLGVYLVLSVLASFVQAVSKGTFVFVLAVLFVCTLCLPTANELFDLRLFAFVPIEGSAVFYVLVGAYVRAHNIRFSRMLGLTGAVSALVCIVLQIAWIATVNRDPVTLKGPACPLVAIFSVTVFLAAKESGFIGRELMPWEQSLAACSFGIYVLHPVVINVLYKVAHVTPLVLPVGFSLLVLASSFGVSWVATLLLKRLPGFRGIL